MGIFKNTWSVLNAKEKKSFCILLFLDITISLLDIFSLALLLWLVQFYIQPKTAIHFFFIDTAFLQKHATAAMGLFFIAFAVKNCIAILVNHKLFRFIGRVAVRISALNLSYFQQASFQQFTDIDSSVQIRKIAFQPFEFCQYLLTGIQQIITQSFLITGTLAAIILFNAKIFLLLLILLLPPVVAVFYFIKNKISTTRSGIKQANELSFKYLLDALKGYVEANIFDRNAFFMKRFIEQRERFSNFLFQSLSIQAMPGRIIELFAVMGLFLLILLAQWSGSDKDSLLTIGAFMVAAYKVIPGLVKLINITGQMKAYEPSLHELVLEQQLIKANPSSSKKSAIKSLQFKNVAYQYTDLPVLQDVNFSIDPGDFIGIAAPSGKGKTTLLNLMLGFLAPTDGEILVNGNREHKDTLKQYWPSIAYVRQQSFLINDSVIKNITLQEDAGDKDRLSEALHISGIDTFLSAIESEEKLINENGKNISGGQQQRIAIARALYKDADLFLLDEPFNELDERSENLLLKHFQKLSASGKSVVMITHREKSLSYCTKIVSLDGQQS